MCCRSWIALIEDVWYSSNFKMGDVLHMVSIICLMVKLIKTRSCGGVSGKTLLLFAIVYLARNLDMSCFSVSYSSLVNITFMVGYYIVCTVFFAFRNSYRHDEDTFMIELLLIPSLLLAICSRNGVTSVRLLETFSVYLESVAILPQFYMIYKMGEMETNLLYYLIPLGLCRLFYVIDCIESYATDHFDVVAHSAGIIYLSVYLLALIIFCVSKIKIVDEENRRILKSNIFFVNSSEPRRENVDEEKIVIPEQLMEKF